MTVYKNITLILYWCQVVFRCMWILTESKQSVTNLGIPQIIAVILFEKFGKNTFAIAKWYKESATYLESDDVKGWWRKVSHSFKRPGVVQFVDVYEASEKYFDGGLSIEEYNKIRDRADIADIKPGEHVSLSLQKEMIADEFFGESFFKQNLIAAVQSKQIKDIKPYSALPYHQANAKYEEKSVFQDKKPVKVYPNGWKWVDAGAKCDIIGKQMKNCGSTGVMSSDRQRTMMTLVDPGNKPHVVSTYSPTEKRISGIEGQASSKIKDEYIDYVLDLANVLGVEIDTANVSSKLLKLRWVFKTDIRRIPGISDFNEFFLIKMPDGSEYYSDSFETFPAKDLENIKFSKEAPELFGKLTMLFGHGFRDDIVWNNPWAKAKYGKVQSWNPAASLMTEGLKVFISDTLKSALHQEILKARL